jgi:acetolactate decarboxylase
MKILILCTGNRTNTRVISKSSPCLTDAAVYLTGGRYQYNSFYVNDSIKGMYIVQWIDNAKTVVVSRNKNVKPAIIDEMGDKAIRKELSYAELRKLKKLEEEYSKKLKKMDPALNFTVTILPGYQWKSVINPYFIKTDIINKNIK